MRKNPFTFIFPILLLVVSVWSWGTSAIGLWSWFVESIDFWLAAAAGLAMSAFIQVSIAGMWFGVTSRRIPILIKPFCMALALSLSVISGSLASGSYLLMTASDAYEALLNRRSFETVSDPLFAFGDRFSEIEQRMLEFSLLSGERERIEASSGASCDGARVQPGHGPRARMRQRLKGESSKMAAIASIIAGEAINITTLPGAVDDAKMAKAYAAARALAKDGRITQIRRWINRTLRDFREGFHDAPSDKRFECPDSAVETSLSEISELLSAGITLPRTPPAAIELGFTQAVRNSYGQVWSAINAVLGLDGANWDREAFHTSLIAFIIAGMVEALIISFVFLTAAMSGASAGADAPRGTPVAAYLRDDWESMLTLLDHLIIEEAGIAYFLVPENGDPKTRNQARNLARRWRMPRTARAEAVNIADISPVHHQVLANGSGGATLFTIYVAPPKLMRWWVRAANDLAASPASKAA